MTDDEAKALGLRLVACDGFRWMGGMLYVCADGGCSVSIVPRIETDKTPEGSKMWSCYHWPDLRDPATRGCVLELVREAWGNPRACVALTIGAPPALWHVVGLGPMASTACCETEAEALVAALEAAP